MILSHAEIYRGDPRSRNRISCCYEFLIARGVMLGAFSHFGVHECSEQCRVGAIVVLREPENEPNCLGVSIRFNTAILVNFS